MGLRCWALASYAATLPPPPPAVGHTRDADMPCYTVSSRAGADDTPGATVLDTVSVSSDEDDEVPACDFASVDPDDTIAAN